MWKLYLFGIWPPSRHPEWSCFYSLKFYRSHCNSHLKAKWWIELGEQNICLIKFHVSWRMWKILSSFSKSPHYLVFQNFVIVPTSLDETYFWVSLARIEYPNNYKFINVVIPSQIVYCILSVKDNGIGLFQFNFSMAK